MVEKLILTIVVAFVVVFTVGGIMEFAAHFFKASKAEEECIVKCHPGRAMYLYQTQMCLCKQDEKQ